MALLSPGNVDLHLGPVSLNEQVKLCCVHPYSNPRYGIAARAPALEDAGAGR